MNNKTLFNECRFLLILSISILTFNRACKMKFESSDQLANHVKKVSFKLKKHYYKKK